MPLAGGSSDVPGSTLFLLGQAMTHTPARFEQFPPLPLEASHWEAVFNAMAFSPKQKQIVELVLRGMCDKQIAAMLNISAPTVRTYLNRIAARTRTRGRMELAMRVFCVSHQITVERLSSE
jgi:DNA-binding CsgD family transcriptional regulator